MDQLRATLTAGDERRQALRTLGGLLLGAGMLLVFVRRGSDFADPWGDALLFLVLLAPCAFLYGAGWLGAGEGRRWPAVYLVFGTLLIPPTLFQLLEWLGGTPDAPLNIAWIFLLTAAAGAAAARSGGVRFGVLLAGLALVVAWLGLWDELLSKGAFDDPDTTKILFLVIGAALAAVGAAAAGGAGDAPDPRRELVTSGGIAIVFGLGVLPIAESGFLITDSGQSPQLDTGFGWDALLLVVSLGLIAWGSRAAVRGPSYVGAVGLAIFIVVAGLDLDDSSPAGKLAGWPLGVLVAGAAAFLASIFPGRGSASPPPASVAASSADNRS